MKTKTCKKCLESKPTSEFHRSSAHLDGLNTMCKLCRNAKIFQYRKDNKDKVRIVKKAWDSKNRDGNIERQLNVRYSITLKDYDDMLSSQNGACAFCKVPATKFKTRLHVDHDHSSGKIRGLLCSPCNVTKVGSNTIESAKQLLDYLTKYG